MFLLFNKYNESLAQYAEALLVNIINYFLYVKSMTSHVYMIHC